MNNLQREHIEAIRNGESIKTWIENEIYDNPFRYNTGTSTES